MYCNDGLDKKYYTSNVELELSSINANQGQKS